MSQSKYHKTIFLPALHGQYKLWKYQIAPMCNKAEEIVQFGNIIGCNDFVKDQKNFGPNENTLKYTLIYRATEDNWIQLVGPNEIMALNFPEEWTNKRSRQILRQAWLSSNPTMQVAAVHDNRLLTHGGLTYGEWIDIDRPETAESAAKRLNDKYRGTIYQGACYSLNGAPNHSANPIWADPLLETYPSWIGAPETLPFIQMHESRNLNSSIGRSMVNAEHSIYQYATDITYKSYGSHFYKNEQEIIGIYTPLEGKLLEKIPSPYMLYVEKREK